MRIPGIGRKTVNIIIAFFIFIVVNIISLFVVIIIIISLGKPTCTKADVLFKHRSKGGRGQTHVLNIMLQILYISGGLLES